MEEKQRKYIKTSKEESQNIISKFKRLETERTHLDTLWDEISKYFAPRKQNITSKSSYGAVDNEADIFDTTGVDALLTAAAGLMSWTTPKSEPWFTFEAPKKFRKNTAVRKWLSTCTEIAQEQLADSNFYSERHESLMDKLIFGTSALFSQVDDENKTYFCNVPVGTYVIEENYLGIIDTLMRKIQMTARQVVQQFGEENCSKELLEIYNTDDTRIFEIIHVVKPRNKKDLKNRGLKSKVQKPFASLYIEEKTSHILQEGGFETFPFAVGRYLNYSGNDKKTPWGYGIGFSALPDARQLNFLQKELLAAVEKSIFPPILVPDGYEGALDTNANAVLYYDPNIGGEGPNSIKALEVTGDFSVAMQIKNEMQNTVRTKFHTEIFNAFASIQGKQRITAEEVRARLNERLDGITPAFDRDVSECISPMLNRLFVEWISKGILPPPPIELIEGNYEDGTVEIPLPGVVMGSRLALAIKNLRNINLDMTMQRLVGLAQFDPSVLDIVDFDAVAKGSCFDSNFVADYMRNDDDIAQIRQGRAMAAQAQQQAQMMMEGAKILPEKVIQDAVDESGGLSQIL